MNPRLAGLHAYPFEKLAALKAGRQPPAALPHIAMSIGEPKHAPPAFVLEALHTHLDGLGSYPSTAGLPALRSAAARWLERRFALGDGAVDAGTMGLPGNGTREALFAFVQACIDPLRPALVAMPNPFYQIYEGAALLAGAAPYYLNTTAATDFLPDLDAVPARVWRDVQVLVLCSPGNPTGAVMSRGYLARALELAERHDFVIAADECYADLWLDEAQPPASLLEAARATGRSRHERCIVFHSLSKRSSVPGLRSGFVAGDPRLIEAFLRYRTYHGCAMPLPTQHASIVAWNDDAHAAANRALYREKFARVVPMLAPLLDVAAPAGGFYLWPDVREDDEAFTRDLFAAQNLTLLPGSYLAREAHGANPGARRVRISLVAGVEECVEAARRIRAFLETR
ncbi:MAG: succinyldiaminopimelate transaminase [Steroidobacteraceae bacterium]